MLLFLVTDFQFYIQFYNFGDRSCHIYSKLILNVIIETKVCFSFHNTEGEWDFMGQFTWETNASSFVKRFVL